MAISAWHVEAIFIREWEDFYATKYLFYFSGGRRIKGSATYTPDLCQPARPGLAEGWRHCVKSRTPWLKSILKS